MKHCHKVKGEQMITLQMAQQLKTVMLCAKQLKYYFKFMEMADIDLFYIKKALTFYIKTQVFIPFTEPPGTLIEWPNGYS